MRSLLLAAIEQLDGVITRAQALSIVPVHVIDDAVRSGALHSVFPGVYVRAGTPGDRRRRLAAAVAYTGGAVSHVDALQLWRLLPAGCVPPLVGAPVHVTVGAPAGPCRCPGLVVHRRRGFTVAPPSCRMRDGIRVVALERAIVESWSLLPGSERRTPIIVAMRERRTTAARLDAQLDEEVRLVGRSEMRQLIRLVAGGSHSELELFGHARLLADRRLPPCRRQVPVASARGTVWLDAYFEAEMVAVEFDGAAYHGSPEQRERDLRRDAEVAALGILTIRLTHQRLVHELEQVVSELLAVLGRRRAQLGLTTA